MSATSMFINALDPGVTPTRLPADPATAVSGDPATQTWDLDRTPDGCVETGVWEVAPGVWNFTAGCWEIMHIISGRSELTDTETGEVYVLTAGSVFLARPGLSVAWNVVETTRKIWVTYVPAA